MPLPRDSFCLCYKFTLETSLCTYLLPSDLDSLWKSIKANLLSLSLHSVHLFALAFFCSDTKVNIYITSHLCCETFPFHHSQSGVVCRSQAKQCLSALFFPKCKRGNAAPVVMCSYLSVMSSSSSPLSPLKMFHRKYSHSHPEA